MLGDVAIGGGAPVSIQSMTNTFTENIEATTTQIEALRAAGYSQFVIPITPGSEDAIRDWGRIRKSFA